MKKYMVFVFLFTAIILRADTVAIRQPGLVESVGRAVIGVVLCVLEFATGLVVGATTVVQIPDGAVNMGISSPTAETIPTIIAPQSAMYSIPTSSVVSYGKNGRVIYYGR